MTLDTVPAISVKRPQSLGDEVYRVLREAILTGKLPPDQRLVETKLAEELGISRTPVREALHKLELEGLVCSLPGGGLAVKGFSPEEVREIFGIRQVLEGYAARLATARIGPEGLERLEAIHRRAIASARQGKTRNLVRDINEFHAVLNRTSGSQRLVWLINSFRDYFFSARTAGLYDEAKLASLARGREEILRALRAKDADLVEALVRQHLAESMEAFLGRTAEVKK